MLLSETVGGLRITAPVKSLVESIGRFLFPFGGFINCFRAWSGMSSSATEPLALLGKGRCGWEGGNAGTAVRLMICSGVSLTFTPSLLSNPPSLHPPSLRRYPPSLSCSFPGEAKDHLGQLQRRDHRPLQRRKAGIITDH